MSTEATTPAPTTMPEPAVQTPSGVVLTREEAMQEMFMALDSIYEEVPPSEPNNGPDNPAKRGLRKVLNILTGGAEATPTPVPEPSAQPPPEQASNPVTLEGLTKLLDILTGETEATPAPTKMPEPPRQTFIRIVRAVEEAQQKMSALLEEQASDKPKRQAAGEALTASEVLDSLGVCMENIQEPTEAQQTPDAQAPEEVTEDMVAAQDLIRQEFSVLQEIILSKNRKYGNSALAPIRIFSQADPMEQINTRIDDKINRLLQGSVEEDEDVELDLIGYLILKRVARAMQEV